MSVIYVTGVPEKIKRDDCHGSGAAELHEDAAWAD
jgi:hypothetical protein